jgi:hypothetical protein
MIPLSVRAERFSSYFEHNIETLGEYFWDDVDGERLLDTIREAKFDQGFSFACKT